MNKLTAVAVIALGISFLSVGLVIAEPSPVGRGSVSEPTAPTETSSEGCDEAMPPDNLLARQGCCSWHGGVCGCEGNRALCCDGTLSPSCGC